tara:strand:- start:1493 stop:2071 length:579 start_codon:yes stop_codon:yes gene_type:complete
MYRIFGCPIYEDVIRLTNEEESSIREEINSIDKSSPRDWLCHVDTSFDSDNQLHLSPVFSSLASKLNDHAINFARNLNFKFSQYTLQMHDLWCNFYTKYQSQEKHSHGRHFLSCAYFFSAPENSAPLIFFNPTHEAIVNFPTEHEMALHIFPVKPEKGKVIIFPSWLEHGVKLNKTIEPRITFSCNWDIKDI